jgi:hypothetical protein
MLLPTIDEKIRDCFIQFGIVELQIPENIDIHTFFNFLKKNNILFRNANIEVISFSDTIELHFFKQSVIVDGNFLNCHIHIFDECSILNGEFAEVTIHSVGNISGGNILKINFADLVEESFIEIKKDDLTEDELNEILCSKINDIFSNDFDHKYKIFTNTITEMFPYLEISNKKFLN